MVKAMIVVAVLAALCVNALAFKEAFEPGNSTAYLPGKSSSFEVVPAQMFFLGYADNTHLKGYQGEDIVQLGDYYSQAKFGAITDCNSPDFNHVDGIVGFGLPIAHPMAPPPSSGGGGGAMGAMGGGGMMPSGGFHLPGLPHKGKPTLPPPLLFSLTETKSDPKNIHQHHTIEKNGKPVPDIEPNYIKQRAFAFMSTDTAAELQLGGYDPASVDGPMFVTPSISVSDYTAVGLSLKYGTTELLQFTTKDPRTAYLPAIMDSGTSCLVIPQGNLDGLLKDSPYDIWKGMVNDTAWPNTNARHSFFLNIAGATFEIPFDDWFLAASNQSCVQRSPKGFSGMLIGDVLFRRYVVLFDLTHFNAGRVLIGIGKQKKGYKPATKHEKIKKIAMAKKSPHTTKAKIPTTKGPRKGTATHGHPHGKIKPPLAMDRIPLINQEDTQYFINVSMGTPRQQLTVIFDTGSAVFGVFSRCSEQAPSFGTCMFGGLPKKADAASLMDGIYFVLGVSGAAVIIGVLANLGVRKWHDRKENDTIKAHRKKGGKVSATGFGPERLYGSFAAVP